MALAVVETPTPEEIEAREVKDALTKITKLFTDLTHPTRVAILGYIKENGPQAPVDMYKDLGMSLGTVAYHVRILTERLGMLELKSEDRVRGAVKHTYRLSTRGRRVLRVAENAAKALRTSGVMRNGGA